MTQKKRQNTYYMMNPPWDEDFTSKEIQQYWNPSQPEQSSTNIYYYNVGNAENGQEDFESYFNLEINSKEPNGTVETEHFDFEPKLHLSEEEQA